MWCHATNFCCRRGTGRWTGRHRDDTATTTVEGKNVARRRKQQRYHHGSVGSSPLLCLPAAALGSCVSTHPFLTGTGTSAPALGSVLQHTGRERRCAVTFRPATPAASAQASEATTTPATAALRADGGGAGHAAARWRGGGASERAVTRPARARAVCAVGRHRACRATSRGRGCADRRAGCPANGVRSSCSGSSSCCSSSCASTCAGNTHTHRWRLGDTVNNSRAGTACGGAAVPILRRRVRRVCVPIHGSGSAGAREGGVCDALPD